MEMKATLTVRQGRVEIKRAGGTATEIVEDSATLAAGDMVRTGADGIAVLTFLRNTETTLYPATELTVTAFAKEGEGDVYVIELEQKTGLTFNRVNFPNEDSLHQLVTPYGTVTVHGTGYWSDLQKKVGSALFAAVSGTISITCPESEGDEEPTLVQAAGESEGDMVQAVELTADCTLSEVEFDLFCGDSICDEYTGENQFTCPADCSQ
jgi:hypothetical protein